MLVKLLELGNVVQGRRRGYWRRVVVTISVTCGIAATIVGCGMCISSLSSNISGDYLFEKFADWSAAIMIVQCIPLVLLSCGFAFAIARIRRIVNNSQALRANSGVEFLLQSESNNGLSEGISRLYKQIRRTYIGGMLVGVMFMIRAILWCVGTAGFLQGAAHPDAPACGPGSHAAAALTNWIGRCPGIVPAAIVASEPLAGMIGYWSIAEPRTAGSKVLRAMPKTEQSLPASAINLPEPVVRTFRSSV